MSSQNVGTKLYLRRDSDIDNSISTNISSRTSTSSNLSSIFDYSEELDNEISFSIDSSPWPSFPLVDGFSQYGTEPPLTSVFDEGSLSSSQMGAFMAETLNAAESNLMYGDCMFMGSELKQQELYFQGMQRVFNPRGLKQATCNETQQLVNQSANSTNISSYLEKPTFRVGKLSAEQKKEKIHRYLKKRNKRNFTKIIKYACRKTLADSRPRVKGRFAKNDDGEVVVREEEEMADYSDILAWI